MNETGARLLFAGDDFSPFARQRDLEIAKALPLHLTPGLTVHPLEAMRHANGEPHTVFGPFALAWKARLQPQVRDVLRPPVQLAPPPDVWSLPLASISRQRPWTVFPPGEAEAQKRLKAFVDWVQGDQGDSLAPIYRYEDLRNRLDNDGTSRLSPYLSLGMLSARQAVVSASSAMVAAPDAETRHSAELWLEALIKREFALSLQYHYPGALELGFRGELHNAPW
jgi:deoxyribodipyrimidine photo-lyase